MISTLLEWIGSEHYRGCAFINSVNEFGETMPQVIQLSQQYKQDMTKLIESLIPDSTGKESTTNAIDDAILRSQIDQNPDRAILKGLEKLQMFWLLSVKVKA